MEKKKIAVISLILCIVAVISVGSLAWFTDEDEVDNSLKFVTDFSMDLYETDENGATATDINGKTIGQTYTNLTPGKEIHKDPTVINKSSTESMYVRMTVTVDNASVWSEVVATGTDLTTIFTDFDSTKWTRDGQPKVDNDKITYVYYLNDALEPGKTATLFKGVKIPTSLTAEQASEISVSHITVKAEAVQTTDLGDNITTAKQAFAVVEGN